MRTLLALLLGLGAIAFVAYSAFTVVDVGGAVVLDRTATARIMSVQNGLVRHSAVGLTYTGFAGAALVAIEVLLVVVAALLALFTRGRRRASGLFALVAWAGLWFGNAVWLQSRGWDRAGDVAALAGAFIVTLGWAMVVVAPNRRKASS